MRSIARRARRGVIPAHSNITMSALLASSFVGRVAAFKATKVQVRFFRVFFSRRATRSRTTKSSREDEDVDDEECAMVGRSRGIDRARARRVRASREAARDGGAETTRVGKWDARSHRVPFPARVSTRASSVEDEDMICSIERQGWARKIVHGCASWVGVRLESGLVDGCRLVVVAKRVMHAMR